MSAEVSAHKGTIDKGGGETIGHTKRRKKKGSSNRSGEENVGPS